MLPQSLEAATVRMMAKDSVAREAAVFGDDFVEHFGGTREHEVKLWNEAVTNWEGKRPSPAPSHPRAAELIQLPQWRGTWSSRKYGKRRKFRCVVVVRC